MNVTFPAIAGLLAALTLVLLVLQRELIELYSKPLVPHHTCNVCKTPGVRF